MAEEKAKKQSASAENKKLVDPGTIKGKIDQPDNRERRDGPGGN